MKRLCLWIVFLACLPLRAEEEFRCQPESAGITVSSSGVIAMPGTKNGRRGFHLRLIDPKALLRSIWCFKLGDSLLMTFGMENKEEAWGEAARVGLSSGKEEWHRRFPGTDPSVPVLDEHGLYTGSGGRFSKVGLKTGNLLWSVDLPCARYESVRLEGGSVTFRCDANEVRLDKESGKRVK